MHYTNTTFLVNIHELLNVKIPHVIPFCSGTCMQSILHLHLVSCDINEFVNNGNTTFSTFIELLAVYSESSNDCVP